MGQLGYGLLLAVVSYLIGSIPTAYLICRAHGVNIFEIGSGNMGATNVSRALGLKWALAVAALDIAKGAVAVLMGRAIMASQPDLGVVIGAICAVVGHNWSVFVLAITGKLRGGKGVATSTGTWLLIAPPPLVLVTAGTWGVVALTTRYISLAVLVSLAIGTPAMLILIGQGYVGQVYLFYTLIVAALIVIRHKSNIERLLQGRENKFGLSSRRTQPR